MIYGIRHYSYSLKPYEPAIYHPKEVKVGYEVMLTRKIEK